MISWFSFFNYDEFRALPSSIFVNGKNSLLYFPAYCGNPRMFPKYCSATHMPMRCRNLFVSRTARHFDENRLLQFRAGMWPSWGALLRRTKERPPLV